MSMATGRMTSGSYHEHEAKHLPAEDEVATPHLLEGTKHPDNGTANSPTTGQPGRGLPSIPK
jgi:hypothetical protein